MLVCRTLYKGFGSFFGKASDVFRSKAWLIGSSDELDPSAFGPSSLSDLASRGRLRARMIALIRLLMTGAFR
jgi:hypothetical protein